MPLLGYGPPDQKRYTDGCKDLKALAKILDTYLQGKEWITGSNMTIADLYVGSSMILAF
jgi:glutathione S-transferase